jgi:hypothetical protein
MTRVAKLLSFGMFFGLLLEAHAQTTVTAKSCNESDVASAIKSANVAGAQNTVSVPAGTCTWTTALTVNVNSTASLSIIGAGTSATGGGDQTVIIDNVNHSSNDYTVSITTGGPATKFRWSGITMQSNGSSTISNNGVFVIGGTSQNVRVDHCHWLKNNQLEVGVWGQIYGVFDHDIFDQTDLGIRHLASGWSATSPGSGDAYGDGSWNDVTGLGTGHFMFVENSVFNSSSTGTPTPANDCLSGGRFAFRFNTFNGGAALQTHPTGHAGDDRGCRAWEIYQNTFAANTASSSPEFNAFFLSAGTGVIWGNTANKQSYESFVSIHEMRSDNSTYNQTATPSGWGYCGTKVNGTGSAWDKNGASTTGDGCVDQPGRGQGDLLSGTFPKKCDSTTGCTTYSGSWVNDASEPIYEWMDIWNTVPGYPGTFWSVYDGANLSNNTDYYLWCNASSPTGCTTFNGTVGTGSGTLASRPSTCTQGVGYWATDQGNWNQSGTGGQGQLYVCSAANTWTLFYTPFTYPHPLVQSIPAPPPPANVNGQVMPISQ